MEFIACPCMIGSDRICYLYCMRQFMQRMRGWQAMTNLTSIMVVEDEIDLADLIAETLQMEGFEVNISHNGYDALYRVFERQPSLVVLDLMLPGLTGLELTRRVRSEPAVRNTPILMLTAKTSEADIIAGLNSGADDYLTKPFRMRELVARIRAILRRRELVGSLPQDVLRVGALVLDPTRHEATISGQQIELTSTQFKILTELMRATGKVVPRSELVSKVVGPNELASGRNIDVHVALLRKKLGLMRNMVQTVRGIGYRLTGVD